MQILYTKCGTPFEVDDDVADQVMGLAWYINRHGYVTRKTTINGKKGRSVLLHRFVMECTNKEDLVDHIDCNKLRNTKSNLRFASSSQNSMNGIKKIGTSSIFKGVTWNKQVKKWQVTIKARSKSFYIGLFDDEHEAGHEYNKAAIALHGDFARINPIGYSA